MILQQTSLSINTTPCPRVGINMQNQIMKIKLKQKESVEINILNKFLLCQTLNLLNKNKGLGDLMQSTFYHSPTVQ